MRCGRLPHNTLSGDDREGADGTGKERGDKDGDRIRYGDLKYIGARRRSAGDGVEIFLRLSRKWALAELLSTGWRTGSRPASVRRGCRYGTALNVGARPLQINLVLVGNNEGSGDGSGDIWIDSRLADLQRNGGRAFGDNRHLPRHRTVVRLSGSCGISFNHLIGGTI